MSREITKWWYHNYHIYWCVSITEHRGRVRAGTYMRLLSLKGCLDRIWFLGKGSKFSRISLISTCFLPSTPLDLMPKITWIGFSPNGDSGFEPREVTSLKEEYWKNIQYEWFFFHATCRFSTMSLMYYFKDKQYIRILVGQASSIRETVY